MAEKAINDEAIKHQDYIIFLGQILDVCIAFKERLNSGYRQIFFREKNADHEWYGTQEDGWGNRLFSCVYKSIVTGTKILEIVQSKEEQVCGTININADLNIIPENITHERHEDRFREQILSILDELQKGYLDDRITDRLISECSTFLQKRQYLFQKESVFYLEKTDLEDYLETYYDFLMTCVIYYNALDLGGERRSLLDTLLHLDLEFEEKSGKYLINFWNPIILNKLKKVNDGVELFFRRITEEKAAESSQMQKIYRRTLLTKAQHSFRWYISGQNDALLHAAIAPYFDAHRDNLEFQIIANNPKTYSSYEGIGELRLGEKIVYEYKLIKDTRPPRFSIAIMGDLHQKPLEELGRYVRKKIYERCKQKPVLQFNIYSKNSINEHESDDVMIVSHGSSGEVLLDKTGFSQVIDENNIVFILDCVELYKSPQVLEADSLDFVKQKYAFCTFDEYNVGLPGNADICDYNALEELYEIITSKQCFNRFGRIAKLANDPLLEFCEKKQKERGRESSIYIYVSDLTAFNNIYNDDQYYIRTERYNQKEIGIIRYSSEPVSELDLNGKDKILVFNMWQFIKNVAIDERNMFDIKGNVPEENYFELDKIFIGIDYVNWPNLLVVHYYCEDTKYDQTALQFIETVLLPIMNNHSQDMFNVYIKMAMYSFFYSAAKSVSDMLFIHLFQDKENLLGKVIVSEENNRELVKNNINHKFKYSSKRFYDMIMRNYDISSNSYIGQFKTSQIIHKNELKEGKIFKRDVYSNVIEACKSLSYDKGYLVQNCKREL